MKHTPGPWRISPAKWGFGLEVLHKTGEKLAGVEVSGLVCMMPHGTQKPEYLANAKLIAAAPELYELALMVLDTSTIETAPALIEVAESILSKIAATQRRYEHA